MCRSVGVGVVVTLGVAAGAQPAPGEPPEPRSPGFDWMQHANGEWLKGELQDLQDDDFEFESDEFDTYTIDFDDVYRFVSDGDLRVGFYDGREVVGRVRVEGDSVLVVTDTGIEEFEKKDVRSIVVGGKAGGAFWSGKLSFGTEFLRGNVDRTDVSTYIAAERRTVDTRLTLEFTGNFSEVDGEVTESNQRSLARFDLYRTERLFFRVPELELFSDEFQNIALRVTPTISAGYTLVDDGDVEWLVTGGVGYRYTRFSESAPGEPNEDNQVVTIFSTDVEWEATSRIDVGAAFSISMPVPETDDFAFRAVTYAEVDLWRDFDLDVRFTWDRVNSPSRNSDGTAPDADEFRLFVGLGYEF